MYDKEIKADKEQLKRLGLTHKMAYFEEELRYRLTGKKDDHRGDNLLMQNAMLVPE